jgi:transposase
VVIEAPTACTCCGSDRIVKMGEDITETLEVVPRQWKVIQTVREKFTCRHCEKISQPPAPFHPTPRGWAGPNLLAMILFEKFGQHQPLNRQAERYAREGVDLSLSTLADQVGACAAALAPIHALIRAHVLGPSACTATTRRCRCWRRAEHARPGSGPMSATIGRSRAARRRPRCSTSRATGRWPTPTGISRDGRGSSRPMPMAATTTSIAATAIPGR